ncbi:enoyl-CoA hydratase-related protein, partial [Allosphingosinicella sp.]|uniref:enoyl-CoA hydratase-related protein n=1 Tax=Allosphingosinicella sp. TaxID=2823234 RepID=UPI002EE87478
MSDEILVTNAGPVMEIRINRPDKKNAITVAMYAALADAFEAAAADRSVRVVTIAGNGGLFTSGNDLRDFQQTREGGPDMPVFRFLRAISTCPKVVIAGVVGQAIGIGTTMLLHCDLVVAGESA